MLVKATEHKNHMIRNVEKKIYQFECFFHSFQKTIQNQLNMCVYIFPLKKLCSTGTFTLYKIMVRNKTNKRDYIVNS